jgi:hypothetical protein
MGEMEKMDRTIAAVVSISLLGACHGTAGKVAGGNIEGNTGAGASSVEKAPEQEPAKATRPASSPVTPAAPGTAGGLPDDRAPLLEPKGPIDPKSAEAAGQVVQQYGALIEEKRISDAEKLWRDRDAATGMTQDLRSYSEAHFEVGKPADMEGAAGSIYITVPIVLYGKLVDGSASHKAGSAILRRVNDVPGSTEAQRRWHIERMDWETAR